MNVEVYLTPVSVTEEDVKNRIAVVIDVLRASSTIVTALDRGARAIIPVADMAEAGRMASNLDPAGFLLGGERGGVKIEGYHLGNSPAEYTSEAVRHKTIIMNTTNGTGAITRSRSARELLIASFLNVSTVTAHLRERQMNVAIVCAGWRNRVSLEDTLCAGMILEKLWGTNVPDGVSDTAHIAHTLYLQDCDRLAEVIRQCNHAKTLTRLGFADDVEYCSTVDLLEGLPSLKDNKIALHTSLSSPRPHVAATVKPAANVV